MSSLGIHKKKYELFKKDAENKDNSHMTRVEAYFEACFHLIDGCAALFDVHINKHQNVRKFLEDNEDIFGENNYLIWTKFQELENKIRPGQAYGGRINGKHLKKAEEISKNIFDICNEIIRKKNITKSAGKGFSQEKSNENAEGV